MAQYGVTPTGFVRKPYAQILADIEATEKSLIDPALDVSANEPIGELNRIVATQVDALWGMLERAYNGFDRDKAEDDQLESLGKLIGVAKSKARFAISPCTLVFTGPATLVSGVNFVALDTDPTVLFTPAVDLNVAGAGTLTGVAFKAAVAGPVIAASGHLTVITTPVVNWQSCTNTADASGGLAADDNNSLRTKMAQEVANTGSSTIDAIVDKVLNIASTDPSFTAIQSCSGFQNTSDTVDGNGLPPHSFEVLVYDGDIPGAPNDDLIAQAILDSKPAGMDPFGSHSGTAHHRDPVTHEPTGVAETVAFSRVTTVPVYLIYDLTVEATPPYVGDAIFKAQIASQANGIYKTGANVIASRLESLAFTQPGVDDVLSLTLGTAPSPVGTTNIPIGPRQLARFESANITVTP